MLAQIGVFSMLRASNIAVGGMLLGHAGVLIGPITGCLLNHIGDAGTF